MTRTQDQAAAEDERRRYLAATFGEDVLVGLATDQPATPRRPLGQVIVQERRRVRREAAQERLKDIMREALQAQDKADAYGRVVENARQGHPSSSADLAKAAHYALEQGIVQPPSTITRLMDQARASYEPIDAA